MTANSLRTLAGLMNGEEPSVSLFQAKILAINNVGTVDLEIGGVTYTNVPALATVGGVPNISCWVTDLGHGRWLVMGASAGGHAGVPVGTVIDYIGTNQPSGYLLLNGQTIVNAQTLYPTLWAIAPAAWRSGANLVLPDARGRVTVGYSGTGLFATIGAIGGSANSNMPDHQHWNGDHTHTMADHTHVHDHTHTTGDPDRNHQHPGLVGTGEFLYRDGAYNTGYNGPHISTAGGGVAITWHTYTSTVSQWHAHGTFGPSSGVYTSYMNATHGGALNVAYMTTTHGGNVATSTVIGGATAADTNYQPYIAFAKLVKL